MLFRSVLTAGLLAGLVDTSGAVTPVTMGAAQSALAKLTVKGRAPKTGYSRAQFGSGWKDTDGNGCDARNDVLARDFSNETTSNGCIVMSGSWTDPYSGVAYTFDHRPSHDVDIDHVVALSDAWQKGAQKLSKARRVQFANDPLNLAATIPSINRGKGDSDAASWLPPNKSYRCAYVARQIAVKYKYGLWVTSAERSAMAQVLSSCPNQLTPAG